MNETRYKAKGVAIVVALAVAIVLLGFLRARRPTERADRADATTPAEVRPSLEPTQTTGAPQSFAALVRVQEEGAGVVAGAQVAFHALGVDDPPIEAETDASGSLSVDLPRAGRYALRVRADGLPEWHGYAMVPGKTEVVLEAGAELTLVLVNQESVEWQDVTLRVVPDSGHYRDFRAEVRELRTGFWLPGVVRVMALLPENALGVRQPVTLGEVALALGRHVRYPVIVPRRDRTIRVRVRGPGGEGPFTDVWSARGEDGGVLPRRPTAEPYTHEVVVATAHDVVRIDSPELGRGFLRIDEKRDVHEIALTGHATLVVHAAGAPRTVTIYYQQAHPELGWASFAEGQHYTGKGEFADDSVPSTTDAWTTDLQLPEYAKLVEGDFRDRKARFEKLPARARVGVVATDDTGLKAARWVVLGEAGSIREIDVDWKTLSVLVCEFQSPDGEPLSGAFADVHLLDQRGERGRLVATLRSDSRGRAELRGLIDGSQYQLTVSHFPRFGFVRWRIPVTPGVGTSPLTIKLEPTDVRRAQVRVKSNTGEPAPNVKLVFALEGGLSKQVWSDADGVATVTVTAGERVHVSVISNTGHPHATLWLPDDLRAEVSLTLPGPSVTVVVNAPGNAGELDIGLYRWGKATASRTVYVDGAGLVRFPQVEPGTYELVCRRGEVHARQTLLVPAGRDVQTSIDLRP